ELSHEARLAPGRSSQGDVAIGPHKKARFLGTVCSRKRALRIVKNRDSGVIEEIMRGDDGDDAQAPSASRTDRRRKRGEIGELARYIRTGQMGGEHMFGSAEDVEEALGKADAIPFQASGVGRPISGAWCGRT